MSKEVKQFQCSMCNDWFPINSVHACHPSAGYIKQINLSREANEKIQAEQKRIAEEAFDAGFALAMYYQTGGITAETYPNQPPDKATYLSRFEQTKTENI